MQMPGFTAGASLYKAEGHYYTHNASNQVRAAIFPALGAGDGGNCLDNCTSRCDNLDGAAYQRCVTRCGSVCFPTGPFTGPNNPSFGGPCEKGWAACQVGCLFALDIGCSDACTAAYTACTIIS